MAGLSDAGSGRRRASTGGTATAQKGGRSSRLVRRVDRYRSSAGWLLADLVRTFPLGVGLLGLASALAIASRAATFSLLVLFIRGVGEPSEAAERLSLGSLKVPVPDPSIVPVLLVTAAGLMAATSLADSVQRIRVARAYSMHAAASVLDLLARGTNRAYIEAVSRRDPHHIRRLVDSDVITLVRALRPILGVLVPLGEFVVAAIAMTLFAPLLSAATSLLVLAYFIPYYVLNRRVMRASRERETVEPEAHRRTVRVIGALLSPQYARTLGTRVTREYLEGDLLRRRLDVLQALLLNRRLVGFVNNLFLVPVIAMLVFVILSEAVDPLRVGAFGLLLSYSFSRLNAVTKTVAAFNRFLPQFERYVAFRRAAAAQDGGAASAKAQRGRLSGPVVPGSAALMDLAPGRVILAVQPYEVDWTTVESWWADLPRSGGDDGAPWLVGDPDRLPPARLVDLLAADDGDGTVPASVEELLTLVPFRTEWDRLRSSAERPWPDLEDGTTYDFRGAVALAPAVAAAARVTVFPVRYWQRLSPSARAALVSFLRERTLILTARYVSPRLPPQVTHVVVMTETIILGIGDRAWFESAVTAPEIHAELMAVLDQVRLGPEGGFFDDLLNDEDEDAEDLI